MNSHPRAELPPDRGTEPPVAAVAPPPGPGDAPPRVPRLTTPGVLSAAGFLVGAWLVFAPRVLTYGVETAPTVNDVAVGSVIAIVCLVRFFRPWRWPTLSLISAALGAWLVAAPPTLGYAGEAAYNDMVAGLLVVVLAGASGLVTLRHRRAVRHGPAVDRRRVAARRRSRG